MARGVLMDEFHLTVFVPRGLAPADCIAVRRALDGARFRALLKRAVRQVVSRFPSLGKVRVAVTR